MFFNSCSCLKFDPSDVCLLVDSFLAYRFRVYFHLETRILHKFQSTIENINSSNEMKLRNAFEVMQVVSMAKRQIQKTIEKTQWNSKLSNLRQSQCLHWLEAMCVWDNLTIQKLSYFFGTIRIGKIGNKNGIEFQFNLEYWFCPRSTLKFNKFHSKPAFRKIKIYSNSMNHFRLNALRPRAMEKCLCERRRIRDKKTSILEFRVEFLKESETNFCFITYSH